LSLWSKGFDSQLTASGDAGLEPFAGRTTTPVQVVVREHQPEQLLQQADIAAVVINALSLPRTSEVTEIDIRPMIKA
jgi:hypothetical protein